MHSKEVELNLYRKVQKAPPPWCDFSLDERFNAEIKGEDDYDSHGVVRELVYYKYGDEASITMGALPPIVSPMFWEVNSGYPIKKVFSLKNPGKCIPEERYERYKRQTRYLRNITKIFIMNLEAYRKSLLSLYKNLDSLTQKSKDIDRRLRGLILFEKSLQRKEWPKLLLIVPNSPDVPPMLRSFTVTPHMEVMLDRGEGKIQHTGKFYYSPESTHYLKRAWMKRWRFALLYAKSRSDWIEELVSPDLIEVCCDQCAQFNLGSLQLLRDTLSRIKKHFVLPGKVLKTPCEHHAFLCHASEDKSAIVRRFHNLCKSNDIKTWFDEDEVKWGDFIIEKIKVGLKNSQFVIVFVTKEALEKDWVQEELNISLTIGIEKKRYVLPVFLGCTHEEAIEKFPALAARKYLSIPIYDPKIPVGDTELQKLVESLKQLILG